MHQLSRHVIHSCLSVSVLAGAAGAVRPGPRGEVSAETFLEWVKARAIPVERWEMNGQLAAYLDAAVEGKRIIFIGEPGHFFSEKYAVQLLLIDHLARRGYRHLFIEGFGATASAVVDDYVRTGRIEPVDGPDADRIERFRAGVLGRQDLSDASPFQRRFQAGKRRYLESLHRLSRSLPEGPLTIHPIDIGMPPGGCWFTIRTVLGGYADHPEMLSLRNRCRRADDEPVADWLARLETVRATVAPQPGADDPLGVLQPAHRQRLRQCLDCLVESLAFMETRRVDGVMDRALVRREPAMFRQVQFELERLPADAKVIMMAHCNHLSRIGADTTRGRSPSVGEMIATAYPGQVYSMWMLHDHGWLLNPMAPEQLVELPSDPRRVESLLARAGATYVLPLGSGADGEQYLATRRNISYFTWSETTTLTKQTDALFFLDEITPPGADDIDGIR